MATTKGRNTVSVYVDEFKVWGVTSIRFFAAGSCHMTADTLGELHTMAAAIGMRRAWFQNAEGRGVPHYDLTGSRRLWALKLGAVFMGARDQARARLRARQKGAT